MAEKCPDCGQRWEHKPSCIQLTEAADPINDLRRQLAQRDEKIDADKIVLEAYEVELTAAEAESARLREELDVERSDEERQKITDVLTEANMELRRERDDANRENARLQAIVDRWAAIYPNPCRADHHGYCQAHHLEPVENCIAKLTKEAAKEKTDG